MFAAMNKSILTIAALLIVSAIASAQPPRRSSYSYPVRPADAVERIAAVFARHGVELRSAYPALGTITGERTTTDGRYFLPTVIHCAATGDSLFVTVYRYGIVKGERLTFDVIESEIRPILDAIVATREGGGQGAGH